jgi:hypothetical protein
VFLRRVDLFVQVDRCDVGRHCVPYRVAVVLLKTVGVGYRAPSKRVEHVESVP